MRSDASSNAPNGTDLALPDAQQIAAARLELSKAGPNEVVVWRNIDADKRPYETFEQEFQCSDHYLSPIVLKARWDGLIHPSKIDAYFQTPGIQLKREQARMCIARDYIADFDVTDPEYKRTVNTMLIVRVRAEIDRIGAIFDADDVTAYQTETVSTMVGSDMPVTEIRKVLTKRSPRARERQILVETLTELIKTYRLLQGEATSIEEVRTQGSGSIMDAIREAAAEAVAGQRAHLTLRDVTQTARIFKSGSTEPA